MSKPMVETKIPIIRPMACKTAKPDHECWDNLDDYYCEVKIDGIRALFYRGKHKMRFGSRHFSVKDGGQVDKTDRVPHLVNALSVLPPGTILDGELWHEGWKSHEVTSVMGSLPKRARLLQKKNGRICYMLFDILYYGFKDLRNKPLSYRKKILKRVFKQLINSPYITLVPMDKLGRNKDGTPKGNHHAFYYRVCKSGGEGVVFKRKDSTYPSFDLKREYRSPHWLKYKDKKTSEAIICGFTLPEPETVKIDGTVSPNRKYLNKWISGLVIGQFVPERDWNQRRVTDLLRRYYKGNKTTTQVLDFCRANRRVVQGQKMAIQPMGVAGGMTDAILSLISRHKPDYLGKVIEIEGNDRYPKTKAWRHPRFNKFREDKPVELVYYRKDES